MKLACEECPYRVLVTTQHRVAKSSESHGYLLEIDWSQHRIIKRIEAPPLWSHFGQRDRGGRRGLRGITFYKDLIWVASCDALFGLDPSSLDVERLISHPYMSHIHEIEATDEGIWVTSTGGNGVFLIDQDQHVLKESWLCGKPTEDLRIKLEGWRDTYHVNTVFVQEGEVFAYTLFTGQVFKMWPPPVCQVIQLEKHCHNVVKTPYGWYRNMSSVSIVRVGDREVRIPQRGRRGKFTEPGWLRGMAWLSETSVLLGSSPATLYELDIEEMRIVGEMRLEREVCWTVHGIYVDDRVPTLTHERRGIKHMLSGLHRLLDQG
ncbi:MAG: hypothetical protein HY709_02510 [Candidatus Latescibacteria bacterium]|nr:hypothetical protein [Candidatus Latescibacterota bacterium]